ncbi:retrotransposon protein, putative, ty1-copia subclass [Tanacetum coccineum]
MSCKWLFKIKEGTEGVQNPRYKARLVAHGFTQREGIDYNEVFSLVVRHTSIRVILALTACKNYELEHLDIKKEFLHENHEEVIYIRRFDEYMLSNGFHRSSYDSCVYYRSYAPGEYIYLLLYVDDILIAYKSKAEIGSTKSLLKREFDMKELGEENKILGMEIVRDGSRKILRVSQSGYVSKILNNFRIDNGKSVQMPLGWHFKLLLKNCPVRDCDVERMSKVPYANAVGSLMYLMVCARPDIAYAVLEAKTVEVLKVGTEHNAVDALTKVVASDDLRDALSVIFGLSELKEIKLIVVTIKPVAVSLAENPPSIIRSVYSIGLKVTILKIMKWYDYDHLDEIEVRREDQELFKFKEGDFPRLRLQDIKDMLLQLVQQKLTNLTVDDRYELNVALRMFTRRIVIQRRVEDLQFANALHNVIMEAGGKDRPPMLAPSNYVQWKSKIKRIIVWIAKYSKDMKIR